jgi:hypothetical protein
MDTTPAPPFHAKTSTREGAKLEQIVQHFQREFPSDPIQAYAKFFAKASHAGCNGTGLLTYLRPREAPNVADLRLCGCARNRRDRFVMKALMFDVARERGGLAFAEGTVCPESELELPGDPARHVVSALLGPANDAEPTS